MSDGTGTGIRREGHTRAEKIERGFENLVFRDDGLDACEREGDGDVSRGESQR
jgi:hypothetical protein